MHEQSPRFVVRILAVHGFLLAAVLALVSLASVEIYKSTRDDALSAARIRQELLARQTGRGIEAYYSAIINDLGWIQGRAEPNGPPTTQGVNAGMAGRLEVGANPVAVRLIAEQLDDRVSALFVYNKQNEEITSYLPAGSTLAVKNFPPQMVDWLKAVTHTRVSSLMRLNGQAVSLVAAPFSTTPFRMAIPARSQTPQQRAGPRSPNQVIHPAPRLLVAVVPAEEIEANFLALLDDAQGASVTLADDRMRVITTSSRLLQGLSLSDFNNADLAAMVADYRAHPKTQTQDFTRPLSIFDASLGPQMVTLTPVNVAQDQWTLFFAYPLSNIDAQVNVLFKRAVFWAAFVAASVTAILVSTAVQTIRWRSRLERFRHQVLKQELTQARRIQEQWLPDLALAPALMDVAAINLPASHISGDFYNWFDLPDGRQVVIIGDVTGHGMAAAFLMATTQLLVRNIMDRLGDPGRAMEEVNNQLSSQIFHGQFVTMLIMTLDFERHQLETASAGHPPPLMARDGSVRPLEVEAQLVLGVEKCVQYPTQRFALPESGSVLLYTDGVLDARNPAGDRYGKQRLSQAFSAQSNNAAEMVNAVTASVEQFRDRRELDDDLTLVAIRLRKVTPAGRRRLALTAGGPEKAGHAGS